MSTEKILINSKQASAIWGGVHPGYWVSSREIDTLEDNEGDMELTLIPVGSGYEIDHVKRIGDKK